MRIAESVLLKSRFSAIGEPKRRILIEQLVMKEMTVSELVETVEWPQPTVSKHLGVLRKVNIVSERKEGRMEQPTQLYRIHQ